MSLDAQSERESGRQRKRPSEKNVRGMQSGWSQLWVLMLESGGGVCGF